MAEWEWRDHRAPECEANGKGKLGIWILEAKLTLIPSLGTQPGLANIT